MKNIENIESNCLKCRVYIEADIYNNCEICSDNSRFEKYIQPALRETSEVEQLQADYKEMCQYVVQENKIYRFGQHYCSECGDLWKEHSNSNCKAFKAQSYLDKEGV